MEGPLSGVRILALENWLAGPFGSMTLSDMGAEVTKIEPTQGDGSRLSGTPGYKGECCHYLAYNRNKRGIVLDLWTPLGKEAFYDLVKVSDVVWTNFRAGVMKRLDADFDALKKINPRIICTNISGFGASGPYKDRQSNDSTIAGISGIMSVTGEPGGRPIRPGPAIPDIAGALYGVIGTISALYEREKTGVGQSVEVTLLGSAIALMSFQIAWYTVSGEVLRPMGSGYWMSAPYGAYKTKDSYIVLGPCCPRIAMIIGAEWLIDDPGFTTLMSRLKHRQELDAEIEEGLQKLTTDEWLEILHAEDIVAGPLNTVDKAVADPQVNHMNMIAIIEHSLGGQIKLAGNPITMTSLKGKHSSPPTLGQHTEEILRGILGYSEDKTRRLKEEQAAHAEALRVHVRKEK